MSAFICPECNGTDVVDDGPGMRCLGCAAVLKIIGGPKVVVYKADNPAELPNGTDGDPQSGTTTPTFTNVAPDQTGLPPGVN